jgi:putative Mn2+ efflux pump MntP
MKMKNKSVVFSKLGMSNDRSLCTLNNASMCAVGTSRLTVLTENEVSTVGGGMGKSGVSVAKVAIITFTIGLIVKLIGEEIGDQAVSVAGGNIVKACVDGLLLTSCMALVGNSRVCGFVKF